MKMKREHYEVILSKVKERESYLQSFTKDSGYTPKEFRWRVFWASGVRPGSARCLMPNELPLYDYLDDSHIDTALRQIMKEIGVEWAS